MNFQRTTSCLLLILLLGYCFTAASKPPRFSFHLIGETFSLDPALIRGSSGSYLFHNLYRGLTRYDAHDGLVFEGASDCQWASPLKLECSLKKIRWSDGSFVTGTQYVQAFQRILNPSIKSVQSDLLLNLKNAKKILSGVLSPNTLGIRLKKRKEQEIIIFTFETEDPEFLYKLAQPVLSPIRTDELPGRTSAHKLIVNGPYKIKKWSIGKKIQLERNPYYKNRDKVSSIGVDVYFIDDDHTALRLYESGRLTFLRRVPTQYIPMYKKREDFLQIPMARFDYIGFGNFNEMSVELRQALAGALKYSELKKLLSALGPPGCPSLPPKYMNTIPCHSFNLEKSQNIIKKIKNQNKLKKKYTLQFSKMGGEDIRRQAEWIQNQWKKHLGLNIAIEPIEQGMLIKTLKGHAKDFFRKGLAIDRPTCLAGIETLTSLHRENYLKLKDKKFDQLVAKMKESNLSSSKKKQYCSEALQYLIKNAYFIPMGEIHFSMLASQKWTGWTLNELNQLDLTQLKFHASK